MEVIEISNQIVLTIQDNYLTRITKKSERSHCKSVFTTRDNEESKLKGHGGILVELSYTWIHVFYFAFAYKLIYILIRFFTNFLK